MAKRKPVHVSEDSYEALKELSEEQDKTVGEIADDVIGRGLVKKPTEVTIKDSVIDAETMLLVTEWALEHQVTPREAIRKFIPVAIGRLGALSKYGSKFRKGSR